MPHIVKVLYNTMLHRMRHLQVCTHGLGLRAHHEVLDLHARGSNRITLLGPQDRPAYDRREHVLGKVGACIAHLDKLGLAPHTYACTIVHDQRDIVGHPVWLGGKIPGRDARACGGAATPPTRGATCP